MLRRPRTSIAAIVSIALVLMVTGVLVGYGFFSYRAIRQHQWDELRSEEAMLADQLAVALTLPLWNFDHEQIDRIIEGAMQNNDVAAVIVRLADQRATAHARTRDDHWRVQRADPEFGSAGLLWASRPIIAGTNKLGTVEIFVTPRFIEAELARTRLLMIASVLLLDAILVLSVWLLLWKLVLKPLREIEAYAGAVSSGTRPGAGLPANRFQGELEGLRASIVSMIGLLDARFDELRTSETRLRVASDSLAESADRLQLALEASRLGVWRRNVVTGAAEWDDRMYEIFGVVRGARPLTYELFIGAVVPEDRPVVESTWRDLVAGHGTHDLQFRIRRPDGEERHLNTQTMVHRDKAGQALWIIGIAADLTDVVRATEESGRLREKLRQGQKMETLGILAAGIAHDFNNLLTGINGFVELGAASLPPDHEAVALLKQARGGAMHARDLVRRILDFSRRVPEAEKSVVHLDRLVRDAAALITAGLPAQIKLSFELAEDAPPVLADAGQVQQVLMNLCVNGAHAIGDHDGQLRIGLRKHVVAAGVSEVRSGPARPGVYACLAVTDNGCGMSPEVCARIFEPFFTTKNAQEGTGLGLSIVQDVITDHRGFIRVRSDLGRGTTFEILLPATGVTEVAREAAPAVATKHGQGQRILVVDDEAAITAIAQRVLANAGYSPEIFNSSPDAWASFMTAPGRFDLLLIDLQMPGLSGAEFAGRVRRATATLPIIVMSGNTAEFSPEDLQRLGGIGVLSKPFDIEALLERVATALRARATAAPGGPA